MRKHLAAVAVVSIALLSGCGSNAKHAAAPVATPAAEQKPAAIGTLEPVPAAVAGAAGPANVAPAPTPTPRVVLVQVPAPTPTPVAPKATPKPKAVATPKPTPTPVAAPNHPKPSGPDGTTCPPGYHYHSGHTAADPYFCATGDDSTGLPNTYCDHAGEGATGTDIMFQEEECRLGPDGHLDWEHPVKPTPTP